MRRDGYQPDHRTLDPNDPPGGRSAVQPVVRCLRLEACCRAYRSRLAWHMTANRANRRGRQEAEAELEAARAALDREHDRAERIIQFAREVAEGDCAYGDNCPDAALRRHGECDPCKARKMLGGIG